MAGRWWLVLWDSRGGQVVVGMVGKCWLVWWDSCGGVLSLEVRALHPYAEEIASKIHRSFCSAILGEKVMVAILGNPSWGESWLLW